MTARNPLVVVDGRLQELPAGDTINGASSSSSGVPALKNLLIYYGYLSSYCNLGDNAKVIADISSRYSYCVIGDGLQVPTHEDYVNTTAIATALRSNGVKIYGYVPIGVSSSNRTVAVMEEAVDQWIAVGVDGIFLDEFGFDFQNPRSRQNTVIDYVHSKGLPICANAWSFEDYACDNVSELPWPSSDWRYTNFTTYNPSNLAIDRHADDSFLCESFGYDATGPQDVWSFQSRLAEIRTLNKTKKINLWGVSTLAEVGSTGVPDSTKVGNLTNVEDITAYLTANAYIYDFPVFGMACSGFGSAGTPLIQSLPLMPAQATPATTEPAENYTTGVFSRQFGAVTITTSNLASIAGVSISAGKSLGDTPDSVSGPISKVQYNKAGALAAAANIEVDSDDLVLVTHSGAVAPTSTGRSKIVANSVANRGMPAFINNITKAEGLIDVQPLLARNKIAMFSPPGNTTSVGGILGMNTPTVLGTATARTIATTNVLTRMRRLGYVSSTTAGSFAGHYLTAAQYTLGDGSGLGGFMYVCRFAISDTSLQAVGRTFVGLTTATSAPTNVEPNTLLNSIGVGNIASSTTLSLFRGGSKAQTAISLGSKFPVAINTAYELVLYSSPYITGVVNYQVTNLGTGATVTGALSDTEDTKIPSATALLTHTAWRTNNTAAAAVGLDVCSLYIETQNG